MPSDFQNRFASKINWIPCQNLSGQTVPPFSIVYWGASAGSNGGWNMPDPSGTGNLATTPYAPVYQAGIQATPINPYACFITNAAAIPAGRYGLCARPTMDHPLLLSLGGSQQDDNDAPFRLCGAYAPGSASGGGSESAGSNSGNPVWTGTRDYPGFCMAALPQQGYVLALPSFGPYAAQPVSNIAGNTAGSMYLLWVKPSLLGGQNPLQNRSPTSAQIPVYNGFDEPFIPSDTVFIDWTGQGWEVVSGPSGLFLCTGVTQSGGGNSGGIVITGTLAYNNASVSLQNPLNFLFTNGASAWVQYGSNPVGVVYEIVSITPPSGSALIRGVLTGNLASGSSASCNLQVGGTQTVYEVLGLGGGSIAAGKNVWVTMNTVTGHYEVVNAGC